MAKHESKSKREEDNASHYQQFQNLPFVQKASKKARVDPENVGKAGKRSEALAADNGQAGSSEEPSRPEDAAALLLSLATSLNGVAAVREKRVDASVRSTTTALPFMDLASINSIRMNGVVRSGSVLVRGDGNVSTGTLALKAAPKDGGDKSLTASTIVHVPDRPVGKKIGNIWPKLQTSITVVETSSFEPSVSKPAAEQQTPAEMSMREQRSMRASPPVLPKPVRGRAPSFDELTEWCIQVKRLAMMGEKMLGIPTVCALANAKTGASGLRLNGSTLRKRVKRLTGLTWNQIGTVVDQNASDVGDVRNESIVQRALTE